MDKILVLLFLLQFVLLWLLWLQNVSLHGLLGKHVSISFAAFSQLSDGFIYMECVANWCIGTQYTYNKIRGIYIGWWCCNIATDEWEVDYWKGHHISRRYLFSIFLHVSFPRWMSRLEADFEMSVVYFKLICG